MASIASLALLTKVHDWLRLFEKTAFFVLLVKRTIYDIRWFMLLFVVAMLIYGVPLSMLSMNRDSDVLLIKKSFDWWVLDTLYEQYLVSLGESSTLDNFIEGTES